MIGKSCSCPIAAVKCRRALTTLFLGFAIAALASVGCGGPKLVNAGGKVTYKSSPVPGASLTFVPDAGGPPVIARTDEQGRFTVTTEGQPGAAVGSYKVAITAVRQKRPVSDAEAVGMTSAQIEANHETLIPIEYNNLITSRLTATVSEDPAANEFTFDLK
jgi:hypothetical protein